MRTHYHMPVVIETPTNRFEVSENVSHFLMANTPDHSIFGSWSGRMSAADQRKLFGVKLGKGTIRIDGENDYIEHRVQTCFGGDSEATVWIDLPAGKIGRNFYTINGDSAHELEIAAAQEWMA